MQHAAARAIDWSEQELLLILSAGIIGAVWDSLLVYAGWLQYPSGTLIDNTAPHWIVAMWMLFATTLNVSLKWLKQRPALGWALFMPMLMALAIRLDGNHRYRTAGSAVSEWHARV